MSGSKIYYEICLDTVRYSGRLALQDDCQAMIKVDILLAMRYICSKHAISENPTEPCTVWVRV